MLPLIAEHDDIPAVISPPLWSQGQGRAPRGSRFPVLTKTRLGVRQRSGIRYGRIDRPPARG